MLRVQAADHRRRHGAPGIYQEVSSVQNTTSTAGPILSKRALESTVLVDDSQIVVLGGLIQDSLTDNAQKLPWAGDVPVLGSLFRYDTRERQKTNLMVFLKPTIIRGAVGGARRRPSATITCATRSTT